MTEVTPSGIKLEDRFEQAVERLKLRMPEDAPIKRQVGIVRDAYDGTLEPGSDPWKAIWVPRIVELHQARVAVERFLESADVLHDAPGLRRILKDRVINGSITQDFERSQAKDVFYELEIATTMRIAGFDVRLAEPDIVVSGNGLSKPFGLACKYPSSRNRLQDSVTEGYRQILKYGIDGTACLGIDIIVAKETNLRGRLDFPSRPINVARMGMPAIRGLTRRDPPARPPSRGSSSASDLVRP